MLAPGPFQQKTSLPVAIKVIDKRKLNAKLLLSLDSEIAIMRDIQHPNIVKLLSLEVRLKMLHIVLIFSICLRIAAILGHPVCLVTRFCCDSLDHRDSLRILLITLSVSLPDSVVTLWIIVILWIT